MKKKSTSSLIKDIPLSIRCLSALFFFTWYSVSGQEVQLVKDINTWSDPYFSEFGVVVDGGGKLFFFADKGLYVTTGTPETTQKIRDFVNVPCMKYYNGVLLFAGDDGSGMAFWKTDGTTSGTVKIKSIVPFYDFQKPEGNFTEAGGTLFFTASDAAAGMELWKTDGTSAGTVRVKDIKPGATSSSPFELTAVGNKLFFGAPSGNNKGIELWMSDGTAAGTVVVRDIYPGSNSSDPKHLTAMNGKLYFVAKDGISGLELWTSDGTAEGTHLVKDIRPGPANSSVNHLTAVNETLFFEAQEGIHGKELWKSDGTEAGTVLVKDITPGPGASAGFAVNHLDDFFAFKGELYFVAFHNGHRLWKSDGTAAGTIPLTPAGMIEFAFLQNDMDVYNDELYFLAQSDWEVVQLWKTDGTVSGTQQVNPALAHFNYGSYAQIEACGSGLYLLGAPYDPTQVPSRTSLLRCEGTLASTELILDPVNHTAGSSPRPLSVVGNQIYFSALQGESHYNNLWRSDGTESGTVMVSEFESINVIADYNGKALFEGSKNYFIDGPGLWISDGTDAGTVSLTAPGYPGFKVTYPGSMVQLNGEVIFGAEDNSGAGRELWKTDGTVAGTVMIKDIYPGAAHSSASHMVRLNDKVLFAASTATEGHELWRTDGTEGGTVLVKDIRPSTASSYPQNLGLAETQLYFVADDGAGFNVWRSDGTAAGTIKLSNFTGGDPLIGTLTAFNDNVLFTATDALGNRALWMSNGTPEGTSLVKDFFPGKEIIAYIGKNDQYTFWMITNNTGSYSDFTSLWRSDGTPEGTVKLYDFGVRATGALHHTTIDNVVYFIGDYLPSVWRTDGTSCGTYQASASAVGLYDMTRLGDMLLFKGIEYDEIGESLFGEELYRFTPSASSPCTDARIAQREEVIQDAEFVSAFPNPSRTQFNLNIAGEENEQYQVEVLNVSGKKVESHQNLSCNKEYQFGGHWGTGMYVMKIYTNKKVVTRKLMKVN